MRETEKERERVSGWERDGERKLLRKRGCAKEIGLERGEERKIKKEVEREGEERKKKGVEREGEERKKKGV
jgi:hypothetical protein